MKEIIRKVLREDVSIRIRRILPSLPSIVDMVLEVYRDTFPDDVCKYYVSGASFFEAVTHNLLNYFSRNYFPELDDKSKEYKSTMNWLELYIRNNHMAQIFDFYREKCVKNKQMTESNSERNKIALHFRRRLRQEKLREYFKGALAYAVKRGLKLNKGMSFERFKEIILTFTYDLILVDYLESYKSNTDDFPREDFMNYLSSIFQDEMKEKYNQIFPNSEDKQSLQKEEMKVDSFGRLQDEDSKVLYPYKKIGKFVEWFQSEFGDYATKQGWAIFDSDTEVPHVKYKFEPSNKFMSVYQVQRLDDPEDGSALFGKLKDDYQADDLAKKLGLMLDEYGVVIGWNGESFL